MNNFKEQIQTIPSESLIIYISFYRNYKINKENILLSMLELDKRRSLGDNLKYEDLIEETSELFKVVGKGFILTINENFDLDQSLQNIKNITPAIIFNRQERLIYVGKPTQENILKICALDESDSFDEDQKHFSKVL